MTVFLIFCLKWNIIDHSKFTAERKQAVTNGLNRIDIEFLFDITFISVLFLVERVFPVVKEKNASGDPLVAGFESRPRRFS